MANWSEAEWNELLGEVAQRSVVDSEFRALALRDSTAALKAVSKKPVPPNVNVTFIENTEVSKTVTLPPALPEIEDLSDLDLEQVAGGDVQVGSSWRR